MIKKLFPIIFACFCSMAAYCQTAQQWQADLRHLQQTVHARYGNLFHTISANQWNKSVDSFYAAIPGLGNHQVLAGFVQLVASFHIGHTQMNTWGLHTGGSLGMSLHRYPFLLYQFSNGLYVLKTEKGYADALGGRVTKIGKLKTDAALAAIRPLVSYENEQGFLSIAPFFLATPEFLHTQGIAEKANEVPLSFIKNGQEATVVFKVNDKTVNHSMTGLELPEGWVGAGNQKGNEPLWQKEPAAFRYMQYLPDSKTLYVRHSVTLNDGDKTIAAFFANMADYIERNDVQRLVLDVRMNGGGNNYLNKPIITSIVQSKKINQKGRFYCIIGRRTFSAAQNLVNELEKYTEVIFAGEPTSENVNFFGDTKTEILPNSKLQVNLSWLWWQNLDPRDKRKATSPFLAADMAFEDYANGKDPVLDVISSYTSQEPVEEMLKSLVVAGNLTEAVKKAKEYIDNPVHRYFRNELETKINEYGYTLFGQKKYELAKEILYMNVQLYPESANAYDSYAESLMHLGKKEEAIKYYEMAIAKDKDGGTADNAKKMIEKLKGNG
jgi:tetratricopeptide (TPR) repeat protein